MEDEHQDHEEADEVSRPLQDDIAAVQEALAKLERKTRSARRGPAPIPSNPRKAGRKRAKAARKRNR